MSKKLHVSCSVFQDVQRRSWPGFDWQSPKRHVLWRLVLVLWMRGVQWFYTVYFYHRTKYSFNLSQNRYLDFTLLSVLLYCFLYKNNWMLTEFRYSLREYKWCIPSVNVRWRWFIVTSRECICLIKWNSIAQPHN